MTSCADGTTHKTLIDAIKICARNLFYQALAPFKKLYNNYRDDHVRFRELTRFDGVLRHGAAGMEVHLVTQMHLVPKQRRIITEVIGTINASALPMPDGSGRKMELRLTDKCRDHGANFGRPRRPIVLNLTHSQHSARPALQ